VVGLFFKRGKADHEDIMEDGHEKTGFQLPFNSAALPAVESGTTLRSTRYV
jgi:hypothetical protein